MKYTTMDTGVLLEIQARKLDELLALYATQQTQLKELQLLLEKLNAYFQ